MWKNHHIYKVGIMPPCELSLKVGGFLWDGSVHRRNTINATFLYPLLSMSQRTRLVCHLTRKDSGKEKRYARAQDRLSVERTTSQESTCMLYTEVKLNAFLQSNFLGDI